MENAVVVIFIQMVETAKYNAILRCYVRTKFIPSGKKESSPTVIRVKRKSIIISTSNGRTVTRAAGDMIESCLNCIDRIFYITVFILNITFKNTCLCHTVSRETFMKPKYLVDIAINKVNLIEYNYN